MNKNYLLLCLLFLGFKMVFCQQIVLGTINNDKLELTDKNKRALKIAYLRSFVDGRKLDSVYVDKIAQVKYLILIGSKSSLKSKTALGISVINNTVIINPTPSMVTCSNGACNDCNFFIESNKVVACKCETNGSISNHCTYKINDGNFFYNLVHKIITE